MTKTQKPLERDLDVPFNLIGEILSNYFGVEQKEIFVRSRKVEILKIRYTFMALAKKLNNVSYQAIGEYCNKEFGLPEFHHATIMNACKEAQNFMDTDPDFKFHFEELETELIDISKVINSHKKKIKKIKQKLLIQVSKTKSLEDILTLFRGILSSPDPEKFLIA